MPTKVNFSAVQGPEPLEAGEYECTLIKYSMGNSKAGQLKCDVEFTVSDSNKKIFKSYSLQPQALWGLKRDLIRMGADVEVMNDPDTELEDILDSLIGASVTVICTEPREYDGQTYTNFKEVKDPDK